jgi:hypothetical protein
MRWRRPKRGDKRVRRKFLWFPLELDGETRWLERASWDEEYGTTMWFPLRWVEEPKPAQPTWYLIVR